MPRLTESPLPTLFIHVPARFVNSLSRRWSIVLRRRTIRFKGDHFSRGIISYVSWGCVCMRGIVPHVQIDPVGYARLFRKGDHTVYGGDMLFKKIETSGYAISKGGPHYMRDRLFRDNGSNLDLSLPWTTLWTTPLIRRSARE